MQFISESATFNQSGFNFYTGNIEVENTVIFKEDFIIIGNIKTSKNIFSIGELIVFGDIDCKSIYASKDFFCIGDIKSESIEVEGTMKTLEKSVILDYTKVAFENKCVKEKRDEIEYKKNIKDQSSIQVKSSLDDFTQNESKEKCIENKNFSSKSSINTLYADYIDKKGNIVEGKVVKINNNKVIVKIDDIDATLDMNKNSFKVKPGDTIYSYIKSVELHDNTLKIKLEQNDISYINKVIKIEMSKNKYDMKKIFIKNIKYIDTNNISVSILSGQHNEQTLKKIEDKIGKYFINKKISLSLYGISNKLEQKDFTRKVKDAYLKDKSIEQINITYKDINGFKVGDKIIHNKFGNGTIKEIVDQDIAKIDFNGKERTINVTFLIRSNLIKKYIEEKSTNEKIIKKTSKTEKTSLENDLLKKYESKKHSLINGIVTSIGIDKIIVNIEDGVVGVLSRTNDSDMNIKYSIGDEIISYISNVYINNSNIELQLQKNNSNYFKLLFYKYKDYLSLKKCDLRLCKYVRGIGVALVVDKKYGFKDVDILTYIIELMNKNVGINIVRFIDFKYDPYIFLSSLFNVRESDIRGVSGTYYVSNLKNISIYELESLCNELYKFVSYKIKFDS